MLYFMYPDLNVLPDLSALRGNDDPCEFATKDTSPHNLWHNPIFKDGDWR